jgi:hypothetical protein
MAVTESRVGHRAHGLVAAVLLCGAIESSHAEETSGPGSVRLNAERYSVSVGVYSLHARTLVRLDSPAGGSGTPISFENDLDVDRRDVSGDVMFSVRLRDRHRFEVERFGLSRSGVRGNSRTIRFGEDTFEIGWQLETFFDTDVTRVGYAYSFLKGERHELGLHAGLHVTDLAMGIRATITPGTAAAAEYADASAPLPVVGLQGARQLSERWSLHGRAQIFRLEAEDFAGELNHVVVGVEHATFRRIGFGLALDFFELDLSSEYTGLLGAFKLQFSGPRLYVQARF